MVKNSLVIGADYQFGRELATSLMNESNTIGVGFKDTIQAPFPYSACFSAFDLESIIREYDISNVFLVLYTDIDCYEQFEKETVYKAAYMCGAKVITIYTNSMR